MKASIRSHSLTLSGSGNKSLSSMQSHGMRLDQTSQKRRVRDVEPLVFGSLDLRAEYDKHVDGARMNKSLKRPAMHAIIKFPNRLKMTPELEEKMLRVSIEFINKTHGGNAVFAARLDRDEEGQHNVDVFYAPKYTKTTKSRGEETWISTTKHGKELCEKHRDEIERRHDDKFLTGPRQVGIALQAELHEFLTGKGLKLDDRVEKVHTHDDRLTPEEFKAKKIAEENAELKAEVKELRKENETYKGFFSKLRTHLDGLRGRVPDSVMLVIDRMADKVAGVSRQDRVAMTRKPEPEPEPVAQVIDAPSPAPGPKM